MNAQNRHGVKRRKAAGAFLPPSTLAPVQRWFDDELAHERLDLLAVLQQRAELLAQTIKSLEHTDNAHESGANAPAPSKSGGLTAGKKVDR